MNTNQEAQANNPATSQLEMEADNQAESKAEETVAEIVKETQVLEGLVEEKLQELELHLDLLEEEMVNLQEELPQKDLQEGQLLDNQEVVINKIEEIQNLQIEEIPHHNKKKQVLSQHKQKLQLKVKA